MTDAHPAPQMRASRRHPENRNHPQPWEHVVSVSGGKDSTALYLLAVERGMPFRAVFADTGHEHDATYEMIERLPRESGGPAIETVRADFSADMARKRAYMDVAWREEGIEDAVVDRAISLLHPTGNPFIDLCMMKGRFPSTKRRFCTDFLKVRPMFMQVQLPILRQGRTFISWQGVRADESLARRDLARFQRINPAPDDIQKDVVSDEEAAGFRAYAYRPIHEWTVDDVFAMHRRHGVAPNPLYALGLSRVGCFPCIMCRKEEIRLIAKHGPEHIDRLEEWERMVSTVSKRGLGTFFAGDKTPGEHRDDKELRHPSIREVVDWSKTSRGGKQYDLLLADMGTACSAWGACE